MVQLIKVNQDPVRITPTSNNIFSLEEMQGFVEGSIEIVNLSGQRIMIVNEEGKIKNLPVNQTATTIANFNDIVDIIHGNVIICHQNQIQ